MIINESKMNRILESLNEANTIKVDDRTSAYTYGGKYYIKQGDQKKEISADQYRRLANKEGSSDKEDSSGENSQEYKETSNKLQGIIEDTSMNWDEVSSAILDDEDFGRETLKDTLSDMRKAGINPYDTVMIDSEALYDTEDPDEFLELLDSADKKTISNKDGNYATLYTFKDNTKVLEVNDSSGGMSGVSSYYIEKKEKSDKKYNLPKKPRDRYDGPHIW